MNLIYSAFSMLPFSWTDYKFMINALTKILVSKTQKTDDEKAMLALLQKGGDYVDKANLKDLLQWYENIA